MPKQECLKNQDKGEPATLPLSFFACPNSDCADFNHFDADNLSIAEWMGKDKDPPLILIDDHLPYPRAILTIFGLF